MNQLYRVRHGRCGNCGAEASLYVLRLTPGQNAEIVPLDEAGSQIGHCERCLVSRIAHPIRAYFGVEVSA